MVYGLFFLGIHAAELRSVAHRKSREEKKVQQTAADLHLIEASPSLSEMVTVFPFPLAAFLIFCTLLFKPVFKIFEFFFILSIAAFCLISRLGCNSSPQEFVLSFVN